MTDDTTNILTMYLDEAAGHELPAPLTERGLFGRLESLWPLAERDHSGPIPPPARATVERIMSYYYRLVVSIAMKYKHYGVEAIDLIQEGNLGMLHAVRKFDLTRGCKFTTYSQAWIRQAISRSVANDSRTIRIPVHAHDQTVRINQAKTKLLQELNHTPTIRELAAEVGFSEEHVVFLSRYSGPSGTDSLDEPFDTNDDAPPRLTDFLSLEQPEVEDAATASDTRELIEDALLGLSPRSQRIIEERYGLREGDSEGKKLLEIGLMFGITRERIRQLEKEALTKLADNPLLEGLL